MIERKVDDGSYKYDLVEDQKFSIKKYKEWISLISES